MPWTRRGPQRHFTGNRTAIDINNSIGNVDPQQRDRQQPNRRDSSGTRPTTRWSQTIRSPTTGRSACCSAPTRASSSQHELDLRRQQHLRQLVRADRRSPRRLGASRTSAATGSARRHRSLAADSGEPGYASPIPVQFGGQRTARRPARRGGRRRRPTSTSRRCSTPVSTSTRSPTGSRGVVMR